MKAMTAGESFLFGNKEKLWIVYKNNKEAIVQEFKNYAIQQITTTHQNDYESLYKLGSRDVQRFIPHNNTITVDISLIATSISVDSRESSPFLSPADFYSIPELLKLSKIITKKFKDINK